MKDARELFEHDLKDLYYVERKLTEVLPKMAQKVSDKELKAGFEDHLQATQEHVARLEQIFEAIGTEPQAEECDGIEGLVKEFNSMMQRRPPEAIIDFVAAGAAQKVEQYEIRTYESLKLLAKQLGLTQVVGLIDKTIAEEEEAFATVETAAQNLVGEVESEPIVLPDQQTAKNR